jgi:hypothetical protein
MDAFGRHEVLHMASFLANAVDSELLEHAQIRSNPEWKALADKAFNALFDLYQAIGQEAGERD